MPYKRKGKVVFKKTDGLKKVGSSSSAKLAESYRRLLEGIHHGWEPTQSGKKKSRLKRKLRSA